MNQYALAKRKEANKLQVKVAKNEDNDSSQSDSEDDEVATTNRISANPDNLYRVSIAATKKNFCKDTPRLKLSFQTKTMSFNYRTLPDTGATRSIISKDLAKHFNINIQPSTNRLFAADDSELRCEGHAVIKVEGIRIKPLISSSLKNEIIIGWKDLVSLGVLPSTFPELPQIKVNHINAPNKTQATPNTINKKPDIHSLFDRFNDILSDELPGTPMTGPKMKIDLDPHIAAQPKKNIRRPTSPLPP